MNFSYGKNLCTFANYLKTHGTTDNNGSKNKTQTKTDWEMDMDMVSAVANGKIAYIICSKLIKG